MIPDKRAKSNGKKPRREIIPDHLWKTLIPCCWYQFRSGLRPFSISQWHLGTLAGIERQAANIQVKQLTALEILDKKRPTGRSKCQYSLTCNSIFFAFLLWVSLHCPDQYIQEHRTLSNVFNNISLVIKNNIQEEPSKDLKMGVLSSKLNQRSKSETKIPPVFCSKFKSISQEEWNCTKGREPHNKEQSWKTAQFIRDYLGLSTQQMMLLLPLQHHAMLRAFEKCYKQNSTDAERNNSFNWILKRAQHYCRINNIPMRYDLLEKRYGKLTMSFDRPHHGAYALYEGPSDNQELYEQLRREARQKRENPKTVPLPAIPKCVDTLSKQALIEERHNYGMITSSPLSAQLKALGLEEYTKKVMGNIDYAIEQKEFKTT